VDIMDDVDPMSLAIDQAAERLRNALHAGRGARVEPRALHTRTSDLIAVLSRAQEVSMALSEQIEEIREDTPARQRRRQVRE
jgi:hypothetical protein